MKRRLVDAVALVAVALLLAGGCATLGEGDRLWQQGRHREALEAYRRAAARRDEQAPALLREGLLHSVPDTDVYDPKAAQRLLSEVTRRYPGTIWAREAGLVLEGLAAQEERRTLEERIARLTARVGTLEAQDRELRSALEIEGSKSGGLVERLQELHQESERLRAEVARLQSEIEELKAIDLENPPDLY